MLEARAPQYLQNPNAQQGPIPDTAGLPVNGLRDALHATMSPELTQLDLIQRAESMLGVQVAKTLIERAGRVDPDGTRWTSVTALTDPTSDILGAVQISTDKQAAPSSFARFLYSPRLLPPDAAAQFNDLTVKIDAARNYATERGAKTGRRHRASEDTIAKLEEQRAGLIAQSISASFGSGDGKPFGNTDELETVPLAGTGLMASMVAISTARSGSAEPTKSRQKRTLGTAAAALMASAFMSACGGAGGEAPAATPRVTTYPTATSIRPTEAPPTATFTAIPPTPTVEASRTPAPRPTPDKSISPVKLEANTSMAQELTKTVAGQVLLNRIDDLAREIGSTRANVLANLDVSYSTDPATGEIKYAFANVKPGGGFGALSQTQGLDTGAFVAGDLKFESKQEDLLNNQYPKMDVDGKRLIVSTGLASSVAGVHVKEIKPDVFKRKFVAYGDDGSIVAEASMDINSSPVKSKEKGSEGKPLPDWKAVIGFLPPTPVVVGEIFTGTAQPAKTATVEAPATPEVKHMQAMRLTDNVSVLPDKKIITTTNAQPLIDALRKSNPEAEKILNGLYYLSVAALMDKNPNPTEARVTEVQAQIEAARKAGKPFYIEEKVQDIAGWDKDGRPLFQTASETASRLAKIDLAQQVVVGFEEEPDMQMRLKKGGTGDANGRYQVAVNPQTGQLYINLLVAPGVVESGVIEDYNGNKPLYLAVTAERVVSASFLWASSVSSAESAAPLVTFPTGANKAGQATLTRWNITHDNNFRR